MTQPDRFVIYISSLIFSFCGYELLRTKIPNKLIKLVLNYSFMILLATLIGGFFVGDSNLKQGLFTFSSVYLGFWLNEQVRAQDERRKLKFFLGVIEQELRYNKSELENLKKNYFFFMNSEKDLEIMFLKFSSITTHSGFLKSNSFDSFVSSRVITALKKDSTFNALARAYTDMKFLQSALGIVLSDFEIKLKIHHYAIKVNGKNEYIDQVLRDLSEKVQKNVGEELAIAFRSVSIAIDSVDTYLNSLSVFRAEEEPANALLIKEDRAFIAQILRETPREIPKEIFKE